MLTYFKGKDHFVLTKRIGTWDNASTNTYPKVGSPAKPAVLGTSQMFAPVMCLRFLWRVSVGVENPFTARFFISFFSSVNVSGCIYPSPGNVRVLTLLLLLLLNVTFWNVWSSSSWPRAKVQSIDRLALIFLFPKYVAALVARKKKYIFNIEIKN